MSLNNVINSAKESIHSGREIVTAIAGTRAGRRMLINYGVLFGTSIAASLISRRLPLNERKIFNAAYGVSSYIALYLTSKDIEEMARLEMRNSMLEGLNNQHSDDKFECDFRETPEETVVTQ